MYQSDRHESNICKSRCASWGDNRWEWFDVDAAMKLSREKYFATQRNREDEILYFRSYNGTLTILAAFTYLPTRKPSNGHHHLLVNHPTTRPTSSHASTSFWATLRSQGTPTSSPTSLMLSHLIQHLFIIIHLHRLPIDDEPRITTSPIRRVDVVPSTPVTVRLRSSRIV